MFFTIFLLFLYTQAMTDALDIDTLKALVSQLLSYAIIAGSLGLKIPQIIAASSTKSKSFVS